MGDADVIPIGTRGRPGRGTGGKTSAASRNLAGGATRKPPAQGKSVPKSREPEPPIELPTSSTTAVDREPGSGIPLSDWMAALNGAAAQLFGDNWEPRLAQFMAFLRRRVTGDYVVDEYGFDEEFTRQFFLAMARPIAEKWFRIEVRGAENIPATGGALVVSNHSGTVPVDGLMTMWAIQNATGRFLRPLGADLVFRMPFMSGAARKGGATLACNEDAERLLRTGVPIIPLSVVGAEEIYPLVGNVPTLARLLGVPYIPITPFFPLLGPLGLVPLPSKWIMEFGEPIRTDEYDENAAEDPMLVFNVTDQVRETIQQTLYSLLMKRQSVFR